MTQRSFNWQDGALIQCIGCIILSFALPGLDSAPTPASTPDRSPQLTLEESGDLAPVKRTGTSIQIAHAGIPVPQKPLSDSVVSQLRKNIFVSVGMTVLVYIAFEMIMHVPLLRGLLW